MNGLIWVFAWSAGLGWAGYGWSLWRKRVSNQALSQTMKGMSAVNQWIIATEWSGYRYLHERLGQEPGRMTRIIRKSGQGGAKFVPLRRVMTVYDDVYAASLVSLWQGIHEWRHVEQSTWSWRIWFILQYSNMLLVGIALIGIAIAHWVWLAEILLVLGLVVNTAGLLMAEIQAIDRTSIVDDFWLGLSFPEELQDVVQAWEWVRRTAEIQWEYIDGSQRAFFLVGLFNVIFILVSEHWLR